MPKRKRAGATSGRGRKKQPEKFIAITSKSYGKALRGVRVYYEGKRPNGLKDDGSIQFGKHILETLGKKFKRFRWIVTQETDSVSKGYGITRVRTSQKLLSRMSKENWDRSRDIKHDIVRRFFASAYPAHFKAPTTATYVPGSLSAILGPDMMARLSTEDKEALNAFLPDYVASEAVGMVQKLQATAQIDTLKNLAKTLAEEIERGHPESWWQSFIKSNILLIQQGYIRALDKLNVAVVDTKFPDFCLVTHDSYIDILEIKRPDTPLLNHDQSRDNYYWNPEMCKAISQVENYIEQISNKASDIRSHLRDKEGIDIKAVRPRGIVLAGKSAQFSGQKQKDDFRLLSHGIKNVTIVTYDELLTRLNNYIGVLERFSANAPGKRRGRSRAVARR